MKKLVGSQTQSEVDESSTSDEDAEWSSYFNLKAKLEGEAEDLRERFLFVIEMWAADKYRYDWLEKRTGIAAARWQNVLLDKQFPTLEMLMVVCKYQPQYTYWLMLGKEWKIADPTIPHLALDYPAGDILSQFKVHRDWIKQKRKSKKSSD